MGGPHQSCVQALLPCWYCTCFFKVLAESHMKSRRTCMTEIAFTSKKRQVEAAGVNHTARWSKLAALAIPCASTIRNARASEQLRSAICQCSLRRPMGGQWAANVEIHELHTSCWPEPSQIFWDACCLESVLFVGLDICCRPLSTAKCPLALTQQVVECPALSNLDGAIPRAPPRRRLGRLQDRCLTADHRRPA